jgi:hypothetical protein
MRCRSIFLTSISILFVFGVGVMFLCGCFIFEKGLNYGTSQYRQRYNDGYTGGVNLSYNGYSQQTNVARGRGRLSPYSVGISCAFVLCFMLCIFLVVFDTDSSHG